MANKNKKLTRNERILLAKIDNDGSYVPDRWENNDALGLYHKGLVDKNSDGVFLSLNVNTISA